MASAAALAAAPRPVDGQYFGRNGVRYERFDFRVLKTPHFDVYYYPAEAEAAELAARMAERWYARLAPLLSHELTGRQPLILYASHPHFEQTTALPGQIDEATGGVTEALKRRIILPFAGPLAETDHVLGHEMVHAFQFDIASRGALGLGGGLALPLWFAEGMAEYLSVGSRDPHTAMWIRAAAAADSLPTLRQLDDPRFFPYRYGHALWAYVAGRWGDRAVGEALKGAVRTGNAARGLLTVVDVSPDTLIRDWHAAVEVAYRPVLDQTRPADAYGRPALLPAEEGRLNVAPALSPDGRRLVFLSERSRFAIEMFLADLHAGTVERRLTRTALDPHFESLQFLRSSGSWHPDGRRFVFAGVSRGRPVLSVMDVERGGIEREFMIAAADEAFNPTWSPDGTRIAFAGNAGGLADLFVLDVADGSVRRLTRDPYADLQPAWSPDGRRIAFVTDRFTTDLETLSFGAYRLALYDLASGAVEPLPAFDGARHSAPQWSVDGTSLFFVSDRAGISDIYRLELATGARFRVTRLAGGATGFTPLSPALATAAATERLVFSGYRRDGYGLYVIDDPAVLSGEPVEPIEDGAAAVLPPGDRHEPELPALLADDTLGTPPADTTFPTEPYRAGLSLDYVAPLSVGVGTGGFGTFVGGGTSLYWSDMLGRHQLVTLLQVGGGLQDVAALVGYQNLASRWNRGVIAGQIPFVSLGFRRTQVDDNTVVDSLYRFRRTDRQVTGILAYPFSRVLRLELEAGYRMSTFDDEVLVRTITRVPPLVDVSDPIDRPAPDPIHQAEASLALVRDNSLFGATSPVLGQRYRLDVTPSFGSLTYYSVLADFRRYAMPVRPYTLAARLVHFGRWGPDSEDDRLRPLFLGYQSLVRGYGFRTFDLTDCPALILTPDDCPVPVFDDLLGSRILVGNLELRFPLFRGLGAGRGPAGLPPMELALFLDGGVAWTSAEEPTFLGGPRAPVSSYGVALRTNLFGVVVLEVDLVHPNDRPDRGWHVALGLLPGF